MQGFPDFSRVFKAFGEPVFHDVAFGGILGERLMMCVIKPGGHVRERVGEEGKALSKRGWSYEDGDGVF